MTMRVFRDPLAVVHNVFHNPGAQAGVATEPLHCRLCDSNASDPEAKCSRSYKPSAGRYGR